VLVVTQLPPAEGRPISCPTLVIFPAG